MKVQSFLKISVVTLLSFSTFIGCGDKFNSDEVGSEDFKLASSLTPEAEETVRFEKASRDVRTAPSINRIRKISDNMIEIRIYKGRQRDGVRFKKFNIS
mgnify:CR=1 FL=1